MLLKTQQALSFFKENKEIFHVSPSYQEKTRQKLETVQKIELKLKKIENYWGATTASCLILLLATLNIFVAVLCGALLFSSLFVIVEHLRLNAQKKELACILVSPPSSSLCDKIHTLLSQILILNQDDNLKEQVNSIKGSNFPEYEEGFLLKFCKELEQARDETILSFGVSPLSQEEKDYVSVFMHKIPLKI